MTCGARGAIALGSDRASSRARKVPSRVSSWGAAGSCGGVGPPPAGGGPPPPRGRCGAGTTSAARSSAPGKLTLAATPPRRAANQRPPCRAPPLPSRGPGQPEVAAPGLSGVWRHGAGQDLSALGPRCTLPHVARRPRLGCHGKRCPTPPPVPAPTPGPLPRGEPRGSGAGSQLWNLYFCKGAGRVQKCPETLLLPDFYLSDFSLLLCGISAFTFTIRILLGVVECIICNNSKMGLSGPQQ